MEVAYQMYKFFSFVNDQLSVYKQINKQMDFPWSLSFSFSFKYLY